MTKIMNSNKMINFFSLILVVMSWVACAPKKFNKDASINACQNFNEVCVSLNGVDYFDYSKVIDGGNLDIIFIDDNSGSMSFEQNRMANKFNNFLSVLENKKINYRIGIITTDVSSDQNSSRAINKFGALQDGKLISYTNGKKYLSSDDQNSLSERLNLFKQTIARPETIQCESFLKQYPNSQPPSIGLNQNCPSGDERGLLSLNLFLQNDASSFLRSNSHFAAVVLSDEDERSSLYNKSSDYALSGLDKPQSVINKLNSLTSNNTFSFHSIIVQNGDSKCLQFQSNQLAPNNQNPIEGITFNAVLGSYGKQYSELTKLTNGINGDICAGELSGRASDYGSQLNDIAKNVANRITDLKLACSNPENLSVAFAPNENISFKVIDNNLSFSEALPIGTKVSLKYECPSL